MTTGALVFPPGCSSFQYCRGTEGEDEINVPASKALGELENVTKGKKRDAPQNEDGRGKAEMKYSVDQNVLVRSIRHSPVTIPFLW